MSNSFVIDPHGDLVFEHRPGDVSTPFPRDTSIGFIIEEDAGFILKTGKEEAIRAHYDKAIAALNSVPDPAMRAEMQNDLVLLILPVPLLHIPEIRAEINAAKNISGRATHLRQRLADIANALPPETAQAVQRELAIPR